MMSTERLMELVNKYLQPFLKQYQFAPPPYQPDRTPSVGDIVEYRSQDFKLLFINDRLQVRVQVGVAGEESNYHDLIILISFIHHFRFVPDFTGTVEQQVETLSRQLTHYADLIFKDNFLIAKEQELNDYRKQWSGISPSKE